MGKAVIIGAGTYGQVYAEYLDEVSRYEVSGFLDDDPAKAGTSIRGVPVLGPTEALDRLGDQGIHNVFAPIGNNRRRVELLEEARSLGLKTPCFIHPSNHLHRSIQVGDGVYILEGCHVMPLTVFEDYAMVSAGVNVAHHVTVGRGAFLSQGSNVGASLEIGAFAFVGIASVIMTGVKRVGRDSVVGAGAVVIRDVPDDTVVVGNPAKPLRESRRG